MQKFISVVIPNYNDARIERTIKSIIDQTFNDFQLIVVEGCVNNDKTKKIYEKYEKRIDILTIEPDKGIFDALNKGINLANGKLIFLIGSDDFIPDVTTFEKVIALYQKEKPLDGICLGCKFVNEKGEIVRDWIPKSISNEKMKWGFLPPHFSLFLNAELYNSVGLFNIQDGDIAADTEWLLRLAKFKKLTIKTLSEMHICMQNNGTSTRSFKNRLIAIKKTMHSARKLGYWNFFILPFVKATSKLFQLRIRIK